MTQGHEATINLALIRAEHTLKRIPLFVCFLCLPALSSLTQQVSLLSLLRPHPYWLGLQYLAWGWGRNRGGTVEGPNSPHLYMCHVAPCARLISREAGR